MSPTTLSRIEAAIRCSWSVETCDPVDAADWSAGNPARGQCGVTALVLHDLLGGDLMVAEVRREDGSRQGVHYWNRLPGGVEVDLTREQFGPHERVQAADVVARPPGRSNRLGGQYDLLRERVGAELDRRSELAAGQQAERPGQVNSLVSV